MLGVSGALHSKTQMGNIYGAHLVVLCFIGMLIIPFSSCQDDDATTDVYIVTLRQAPASHYQDDLARVYNHFRHGSSSVRRSRLHKPRYHTPFTIFVLKVCKLFRLNFRNWIIIAFLIGTLLFYPYFLFCWFLDFVSLFVKINICYFSVIKMLQSQRQIGDVAITLSMTRCWRGCLKGRSIWNCIVIIT